MTSYHRLSIGQKQALHRERMREPAVTCPKCEIHTTAAELLDHLKSRCPGQREPSPHSSWLTLSEVLAMGASRRTVFWWASRKLVRTRGTQRARQYLLRDVSLLLARRGFQSATDCTVGQSATDCTLGAQPR